MEENLGTDFDLSALDYADEPEDLMETEEVQEEDLDVKKNEPLKDPLMEEFKLLEGRPSDEQIDQWKAQHGKVFIIGLDADEYYMFRPMRRLEWRRLIKTLEKQQDDSKYKEAIVMQAVLWPDMKAPGKMASVGAGVPDTLHEMILQASSFLMPQDALQLVRKL